MPADPRIADVLALLDSINVDDVAEDAAFQAQIDSLSTSVTTITAERNALQVQIDTEIAALQTDRTALQTQLTTLDARITALGG